MMIKATLFALSFLLSLASLSLAGSVPLTSYTSSADYPYAVYTPSSSGSKRSSSSLPPLIFFTHGQGSRGDASELTTNVLWNGWGLRLAEYFDGNTTTVNQQTAEDYMIVLPLAPTTQGNWDSAGLYSVFTDVKSKYSGQFDEDKVYCSGYSMGSRAWWEYHLNPTSGTEIFCSALGLSAGVPGEDDNRTPAATSDYNLLLNMPIYINSGSIDTTSLPSLAETADDYLKEQGGDVNFRLIDGADHGSMQDAPFDEVLLEWLSSQSGVDGSDSSSSSATTSAVSSEVTSTESATATSTSKKHKATATSSSATSASSPTSLSDIQTYVGTGNGVELIVNQTSGAIEIVPTNEEGIKVQMVQKRSKVERRFERKTHSARSHHSHIARKFSEEQKAQEVEKKDFLISFSLNDEEDTIERGIIPSSPHVKIADEKVISDRALKISLDRSRD